MRFTRFLAEHWRGRLSLPLMLAGPVAVTALALWGLNRALADWPMPWLAVLNLPLAIWAVVGAFRTADRALSEGAGFVPGFAAYAGAGAVMLAAGTTILARATPDNTISADEIAAAARARAEAGLPPRRTGRAMAELAERDGRVTLEGEIGFGHFNALEARLAEAPAPVLVELDSTGGNIFAARGLARLIEEAGLATHAELRCFSACTLVFAAGRERTLGAEGSLGFHGYLLQDSANYGPVRHVSAKKAEARDREFLKRRGIAEDFIARVHETPPDALWRPTRQELIAAGMLTRD